jgi:hypothetical protein
MASPTHQVRLLAHPRLLQDACQILQAGRDNQIVRALTNLCATVRNATNEKNSLKREPNVNAFIVQCTVHTQVCLSVSS